MSKVIIDLEMFKDVLKTYFSSYFTSQLLDTMNDNGVFIQMDIPEDSFSWIPVDIDVPKGTDIYEVTILAGSDTYREYAFYNPETQRWKGLCTGTFVHVLAWKPHTELFTVPFI